MMSEMKLFEITSIGDRNKTGKSIIVVKADTAKEAVVIACQSKDLPDVVRVFPVRKKAVKEVK